MICNELQTEHSAIDKPPTADHLAAELDRLGILFVRNDPADKRFKPLAPGVLLAGLAASNEGVFAPGFDSVAAGTSRLRRRTASGLERSARCGTGGAALLCNGSGAIAGTVHGPVECHIRPAAVSP